VIPVAVRLDGQNETPLAIVVQEGDVEEEARDPVLRSIWDSSFVEHTGNIQLEAVQLNVPLLDWYFGKAVAFDVGEEVLEHFGSVAWEPALIVVIFFALVLASSRQ